MKITLYELLGLIKDRKAPKKVLIDDTVYYLLQDKEIYIYSRNDHDIRDWERFIDHSINITMCLNDEVLILENNNEAEIIEEEKEIEELDLGEARPNGEYIISINDKKIQDKINELVREVNKIKKEGK